MEYIAKQSNLNAMMKDKKQQSAIIYRNFSQPVVFYLVVKLFEISPNCRHYVKKPFPTLLSLYTVHLNDNSQMKSRYHPDYDPLFKVGPLLKRLRNAMTCIELEGRNAEDEQILLKRRSVLKQYTKSKPH